MPIRIAVDQAGRRTACQKPARGPLGPPVGGGGAWLSGGRGAGNSVMRLSFR